MEIQQLKMFCLIAKKGSLAAAAKELRLTSSAVSHSLKGLEREIGCRLFDRVGKNVQLNQAGEQFLKQIEPLLGNLETAVHSIKQLSKWGQVRLRIGASATFCQYILPKILRELKKSFSDASIQVESHDTPQLIEHLKSNRLDLGIGLMPDEMGDLDVRPLFRDELLLTLSPHHSLASLKQIPRDQISNSPFISYQGSSLTSRMIEDYFRKFDIHKSNVMEIGNLDAIKEMVKLNLGIAALAPWTASRELERGTLIMRPFGVQPIRRHWVTLNRSGRRSNLIEIAFVKLCRQFVTTVPTDRHDLPRKVRG
jgi:LysR family transcriptional regulator, low CO2-responsive transcriptional regulator